MVENLADLKKNLG